MVPRLLQGLVQERRSILLEVTQSSESVLAQSIQANAPQGSSSSSCHRVDSEYLKDGRGVKHILNQVTVLRPSHVWLAPPTEAYSPLQNVNQRSPQQQAELEVKRREAMKVYVGCCVVFHYCIQNGIHVTLEMSEHCQAGRLPILASLQSKYDLYKATTKGCRVGLREDNRRQGPLLQKGWRILTSQKRMAELMDLPCRCSKHYRHGRCRSQEQTTTSRYTGEYARQVSQALLQELDYTTTFQELRGQSSLLSRFGEGQRCVCSDVTLPNRPRQCGFCLQASGSSEGVIGLASEDQEGVSGLTSESSEVVATGSSETSEWWFQEGDPLEAEDRTSDLQEEEECGLYVHQIADMEAVAQQLLRTQDFQHESCEQLLEMLPYKSGNDIGVFWVKELHCTWCSALTRMEASMG